MEPQLTIGQLAATTGVPAKTIRYYEEVGVLRAPPRSVAGYRQYSRPDVHRLLFIRRARALGLSLADLKVLIADLDGGQGQTMRPRLQQLVTEQLCAVQRQIIEFELLERQLTQVLQRLQTAPPAHHADGCRCLDLDSTDGPEPGYCPSPAPSSGEQARTSTLERLTMLAPSSHSDETRFGDGGCGCGCGLSLARRSVSQDVSGPTEDDVREQPRQV